MGWFPVDTLRPAGSTVQPLIPGAMRTALCIAAVLTYASCSTSERVTTPTPARFAADTTQSPPPSAGHNLVYAEHLGMVVLVNAGLGGADTPGAATPTRVWGWTGTEWQLLDSSGPPIRNLAGVTYDTRRQAVLMHGGSYDLPRIYGETWEWSGGWRLVSAAGGPGNRDHTQLAFDAARGRAVLFGGGGADLVLRGDTWELDGVNWIEVAGTGPAARAHHAMHFDPATGEVVLHGGVGAGGVTFGDTWSWDGTRWTPRGSGPPRSHAVMTFDAGLDALVLAGSWQAASGIDMLIRRGAAWIFNTPAEEPPARYMAAIAHDRRRNVLVLFGGGAPGNGPLFNDTWEFDGTTWRRIR
jgi:hypothetical protein